MSVEPIDQLPADGYAVTLPDRDSGPKGFWFTGTYHSQEIAEDCAGKAGKGAKARPFRFLGCRDVAPGVPERAETALNVVRSIASGADIAADSTRSLSEEDREELVRGALAECTEAAQCTNGEMCQPALTDAEMETVVRAVLLTATNIWGVGRVKQ